MLNLADRDVLRAYLLDRGIVGADEAFSMRYCGGGVSCTVCLVTVGDRQMIVKQGLERLKVKETWLCDPNRMDIEQEANRIYYALAPDCAPEVFGYDAENYIYWREAVPDTWRMWKEDLLAGKLDFGVARQVVSTLLTVHNACADMPEVKQRFQDKDIFYQLRVSPYLEFILNRHPDLTAFAEPVIRMLMDSEITLVHGDFSPKNIMTDGHRASVLDYEVAHFGHPAFDLAFFSNHFILKAIHNKAWAESYLNMLCDMMDIYFSGVTCMDASVLCPQYVKLLALLMIARVDGKSPAEYITAEADKALVRACARAVIGEKAGCCHEVSEIVLKQIRKVREEKYA